ncbi:3-hydroxyacyl-CoA dehydrogenase NAD-binding domain-containing protein [Streptomyces sp. NPDC024017]|uniref:3-hydroxyacyl-CoA dehydrogenase NAD-binding domain-containing protein n=1 Tax=Streptomyces sp. NPDC024017 TaxID=3154326 RepID=UPI0033C938D3
MQISRIGVMSFGPCPPGPHKRQAWSADETDGVLRSESRTRGEACSAVRGIRSTTPRVPAISDPPPARPGPPCLRAASGDPWPVVCAMFVESNRCSLPCQGAASRCTRCTRAAAGAGRSRVAASLERGVRRGKLSVTERDAALDRVRVTTDLTELADRDLVVEAATEDEKVKVELFAELDRIVTRAWGTTSTARHPARYNEQTGLGRLR